MNSRQTFHQPCQPEKIAKYNNNLFIILMNLSIKIYAAGVMSIVGSLGIFAQTEIFKDPSYSADERASDLLKRLTLEEKVSLMRHNSPAIPRLGIPEYNWWNEDLHGVARAGVATVFPQTIGMAATFDPDAVFTTFDIVSTEQRAKYNEGVENGTRPQYSGLTVWTPNINIFRDPRWGRGMETYGEDPYLTSVMGAAVVRGLQGDPDQRYNKLHACAKHFAVHSGPEWNRHEYNAENIDKKDLWETYLPAFKTLVCDEGVKEVMCAYNRFEGEPCCASKTLLKHILRDVWKYDDVVVSDCGAISDFYRKGAHLTHPDAKHAAADAVLTGNDLECVDGAFHTLVDAVKDGLIREEDIDVSVHRLLRARFQLGNLFDDMLTPWASFSPDTIGAPAHRAQALEMARKSMTLLKNDGNVLPLGKHIRKIAVLGPNANDSVMMWANYNGEPKSTVTILDGIRQRFPEADIVYEKGCNLVDNKVMTGSDFANFSIDGKKGMRGSFWTNPEMEGEPVTVAQYSNPLNFRAQGATAFAPDVPFTNFSARFETTYIPEKTGKKTIFISADDGFRISVNGKEIASEWHDGVFNNRKYDIDVTAGEQYDIVLDYYQAYDGAVLTFDIGNLEEFDTDAIISKVKDADVIIFAGGLSPAVEGEEMDVDYPGFRKGDRTVIELPSVQTELMRSLKNTGKPLVFVLCAGSAVAIPWQADHCDAIIDAFYPGEAGGTALAEVIAGDYNPAGHLPVTFYASTNDLPDFEDYSMKGRTYRFFDGTPLYPFGHGLSYTSFDYGNIKLRNNTIKAGNDFKFAIPVRNTGKLDGDEVVQIYVRNLNDPDGPLKSLKAFRRINLKAGEQKAVEFILTPASFETYDPVTGNMEIMKGDYEVSYGGTSDDNLLKSFRITIN